MQSTETARRSHRRRPDLNVNTSAPPAQVRDAAPRTPPARKESQPLKGSLKSMAPRPALRMPTSGRSAADMESFLQSIAPVDLSNKENDRPGQLSRLPDRRDSHDLSLPRRQVTRDSLVTNMLLSLDQLSMAQMAGSGGGPRVAGLEDHTYSLFGGEEPMGASTLNSRTGRAGHGYTYSSDFEGADDASRISSQPSRGRRSNSSSGFQSSLGRINSMRETSQRTSQPGTPGFHTRGSKGSKSSSTNSIDTAGYAQVLGSQRWAHGFGGRSSSFDYGNSRTNTATSGAPWHIEFSNSFFSNDEYDAAPTPTVPGGPRRLATVPSMPVLPPPEPKNEPRSPGKGPSLERKRSNRSSKSAVVGRKAEQKFASREVPPPVPPFDQDSAPAPHVGYEKSKETVHGAGANSTSQAKDKPGFFRRVFGSSRNNVVNALSHPNGSAAGSSGSTETVERPGSKPGQHLNSMKSVSTPPSRESHHSATHTLQKKTSAFFRRRKQSFSDAQRPPVPTAPAAPVPTVPPIRFPPEKHNLAAANPSPVTSLRRAMNPYLKESPGMSGLASPARAPSPEGDEDGVFADSSPPSGQKDDRRTHDQSERRTRGFSPDYEPSANAVIRTVDPEVERRDESSSGAENHRRMDTPTRRPPEPPSMGRSGSFLHDNSESEEVTDVPAVPSLPNLTTRRSSASIPKGGTTKAESPLARHSALPGRADDDKRLPVRPDDMAEDRKSRSVQDEEEDVKGSLLALPIEGPVGQADTAGHDTAYHSASSVPSVKIDDAEDSGHEPEVIHKAAVAKPIDEPEFVLGDPTEDDRQKAQRIYDGDEDFIQKEKAAAWMGEEGPVRQRTLRAYMDLYDFANQSVVNALRQVCGRLVFRAETQQVDRLLVGFSNRWCECNPNHGFKSADVIHTICYSIMLLNTDLHLADIEQKMTRGQFVKNTMTTIRQSLADSVPEAFDRRSILPEKSDTLAVGDGRTSNDGDRTYSFRASFKPPPRNDTNSSITSPSDDCGPLVKAPFDGPLRSWETQVEVVLKDIYTSIRDERLPLFGADTSAQLSTSGGLNVVNALKRSPSVLSKTPSEGVSSTRGRIAEAARAGASRWTSKSRSRPRPLAGGFASSRTSFDDGNSIWSPTESSATWSRQSLGRTQTSMSMDSFGSTWARREYHQSIGFANALSQAIIREDALSSPPLPGSIGNGDVEIRAGSSGGVQPLLEDESLELAGPPWVKEGIVIHKHHLDGVDKKAKDRNWTEVFAVVQKGTLSLFSFSPNKSLRSKNKARGAIGGAKGAAVVVGGGNWQENATSLGCFSLLQTLASTLPPPGYSRQRQNVWALSLPSGAVHLFQVGTPDICREFVNTSNYWSARLSTHPLVGGISNVEYGWSDAIVNNPLVSAINESTGNLPGRGGQQQSRPGTGTSAGGKGHSRAGSGANGAAPATNTTPPPLVRTSMQSRGSARSSSFDFANGRPGSNASGSAAGMSGSISRNGGGGSGIVKLPGDRIHIAEWTPPTQPVRASTSAEAEQLETLVRYVRGIEAELTAHNALRSPMLLAFSPRGANAVRAMANWQRKSEYLLRETVKFGTYVDALRMADGRRGEVYKGRGMEVEVDDKAPQGEEEEKGGEREMVDGGAGEVDAAAVAVDGADGS